MRALIEKLASLKISLKVNEGNIDVFDPENNLTSELVEEIKSSKEALLVLLSGVNSQQTDISREIPIAPEKAYYPLSPAQKRIYFIYEFDPRSTAYNMPQHLVLHGKLDHKQLELAFREVIAHHEVFRTQFSVIDENPVQTIQPAVEFNLPYHKLEGTHPSEEVLRAFVEPFDLSSSPLLRASLYALDETTHHLLVDMHHIAADGVSMSVLIRELAAYYEGLALPELKIQYKDYASWINDRVSDDTNAKSFWSNQFETLPEPLVLPYDRERSLVRGTRGGHIETTVDTDTQNKLLSIAEKVGATPFMTLLAIYNILLSRLSNHQDIVIGTPVAGRDHADLQGLVGMFVRTLPIRTQVSSHLSFRDFLKEVKSSVISCFDHQEYAYEELVQELDVQRDTSRNPLFDTLFAYQNFDQAELKLPGIEISRKTFPHDQVKFDLTLTVMESKEGWQLDFEYASDLFDEETVSRFAGYFKRLIAAIAHSPDRAINELEMLSEQEKQLLLHDLNEVGQSYESLPLLPALFDEKVQTYSDRVAIKIDAGEYLPYQLIGDYTNKIAGFLIDEIRVQKGQLVGVMLEREWLGIPVIYAIMKAGAVYVPIDPQYPADRKNTILKDSGVDILITRTANIEGVEEEVRIINLDEDTILSTESQFNFPEIEADDLAYIIHTSGSTGKPKGVEISHYSLRNIIYTLENKYPLADTDSYLLKTNFCFDVSIAEIFGWFHNGGSLAILPPNNEKDPFEILTFILEQEVTHLNFVPSMFGEFVTVLEAEGVEQIRSLKYIFLAGEALPKELVNRFFDLNATVALENIYGPTEGTIYSCAYSLTPDQMPSRSVPIGKPLDNIRLYVLDSNMKPVPQGVSGELYIGGSGVACGYRNDLSQTEKAFVPNPFVHGGKVYKSGDIVRLNREGNIEYLGRVDHQVKIRGFRVETGEIEDHLNDYDGVLRSVVLTLDRGNSKELVAYYESRESLDFHDLRDHLQGSLPDYMIPTHMVWLEKFPITGNGKLDRSALPEPTLRTANQLVAPVTKEQELLVDVWKEVLGLEQVGIKDGFFLSGGDSIKSIQIVSRLRAKGYELSVNEVILNQTIEKIASKLKRLKRTVDQSEVVGEFELSPIQHWFFKGAEEGAHHYNHSVLLDFEANQINDEEANAILQKLYAHHDALRITFSKSVNGLIQVNRPYQSLNFVETFDLTSASNPHDDFALHADRLQSTFDLENGPLLKAGLFHFEHSSRLLMVVHHGLIDGVSWRIVFEDFQTLYDQIKAGKTLQLPLKTDAYKTWVSALEKYQESTSYIESSKYWAKTLNHELDPIPVDHPEGSLREKAYRSQTVRFSNALTQKFLGPVHEALNTQANDLLITAMMLSLSEQFGVKKINVDLEGHGREEISDELDISRTIGWFTSIYPCAFHIDHTVSIAGNLKRTKEALRQVPNKGFDHLLWKQSLTDLLPSSAQVSFNYLGQFNSEIEDTVFRIAQDERGAEISPLLEHQYELEFSGFVQSDTLQINLSYSEERFSANTIESLLTKFQSYLEQIVHYCMQETNQLHTPSDLSYDLLSIEEVEALENEFTLEEVIRLSPTQEGMLYHALLEPDSLNYFQQLSFDLTGKVNSAEVERALEIITERHEVFRSSFVPYRFEHPVQVINKDQGIAFYFEDLSDATENEEQLIKEFLENDRSKLFDLTKDPLMRVTLLKLSDSRYQMVWSHHHIIMDGWSLGIVLREFTELYTQLSNGHLLNLQKAAPYSQYLNWINNLDHQEQEEFWTNYLEDFDEVSKVPGKIVQGNQTGQGVYSKAAFTLDDDRSKALVELCQNWEVTLNTLMQTCWTILLSRFNNSGDIMFGYTVSGRPAHLEEVESMVGLCINTLPIRIQFDAGHNTFEDLMSVVQFNATNCQPHHFDALNIIQNTSVIEGPLFDHIMVFENFPLNEALDDQKELSVGNVGVFEQTNYPLTIVINPGKEIGVEFRYDQDLFDKSTMQRLAIMFEDLIAKTPDHIDHKISDIEIISEEERDLIFNEFNQTDQTFPADKTVIDLLEESCQKYPENIAVSFEDQEVTYQQFGERVNQYCAYLREVHHIEKEDVVAIVGERSLDMLVATFGIMKAGGVYLPIDPKFPASKVAYMIEKANTKLILHDKGYVVPFDTPVVQQEINNSSLFSFSGKPITNGSKPEQLAYIIFTSGSTGKPKGVMIEHHSLTNRIHWMQENYPLDHSDVILQKTPLIFDVSVWELFWWAFNGASLRILSPGEEKDPGLLIEAIEDNKVTTMHFVPTMLHAFLDYLDADHIARLTSLKRVFSSGEALMGQAVDTFDKLLFSENGTQLINLYGPTEATIDVSYYNCFDHESRSIIPIGRPIDNTKLYVLSEHLNLQPIGVEGDLYIAGEGLARGYIAAEALTNERFITNPFDESSKLYRTGDVARWLPDGNLEFLGRSDHQVKIKGFRIELGEIEFQLAQHEQVHEAVVLVKENEQEKYLVGYVTGHGHVSADEIRGFLKVRLQDYMIPEQFVVMEHFPQTPSGKIDRKLLPEPEMAEISSLAYEAPTTSTEIELARIWEEVLNKQPIGVDQDFFKLGGDSIVSIRLVAKINKAFNCNITIADLYKFSTIRDMASNMLSFSNDEDFLNFKVQVEKEVEELKSKVLPLLSDREEIEDIYPMSDIERGMVFYSMANPEDIAYYDQFNFLVKFKQFSEEVFHQALWQLGRKHESLRSAYEISGSHGELRKVYFEPNINFDYIDLTHLDRESQGNYIKEYIYQAGKNPFNIAEKSLWRVCVFYLGEDNYNLLFQFHHAILDGWSVATLFTELYSLFTLLLENPDHQVEPLSVSYKDYVVHEMTVKRNAEVARFWEEKLSDYKRLDIFSQLPEYHMQKFVVEEDLTSKLLALSEAHNLPMQSILFTAYLGCMKMLSYEDDITLGIVTNNRPALEESDQMLGCFLNTMPFRMNQMDPSDGWLELAKSVNAELIALRDKQALSLFEISRRLNESFSDQNHFSILFSTLLISTYLMPSERKRITSKRLKRKRSLKPQTWRKPTPCLISLSILVMVISELKLSSDGH